MMGPEREFSRNVKSSFCVIVWMSVAAKLAQETEAIWARLGEWVMGDGGRGECLTKGKVR